jgi:hypothetical protein
MRGNYDQTIAEEVISLTTERHFVKTFFFKIGLEMKLGVGLGLGLG